MLNRGIHILVGTLLISCATSGPPAEKIPTDNAAVKTPPKKPEPAPEPAGIADSEISLRKDSVLVTAKALPAAIYAGKDPGENKRYARSFDIAPPMIPHALGYLGYKMGKSIKGNECLECHLKGDDGAPAVPISHRTESVMKAFKRTASKNGQVFGFGGQKEVKDLSGTRHNCLLCHAPQATNLKPLVPLMR